MTSNSEIKVAKGILKTSKELFMLLKISLLCVAIAAVTYGILYSTLKPPINPPGSEFEYICKYDEGISYADHIGGRINEHRQARFMADIRSKTVYSFLLLFVLIVLIRYVVIISKWVKETSQQELESTSNK